MLWRSCIKVRVGPWILTDKKMVQQDFKFVVSIFFCILYQFGSLLFSLFFCLSPLFSPGLCFLLLPYLYPLLYSVYFLYSLRITNFFASCYFLCKKPLFSYYNVLFLVILLLELCTRVFKISTILVIGRSEYHS